MKILNMKKITHLLLILLIVSCSIDRKDEIITGIDGRTTLVRTSDELPGENCTTGGLRIQFGLDLDFNGTLEDNEVETTNFVCNGLDGEDGNSSLVKVTAVDGTDECPNGGVQVSTGFDLNGNGQLDDDEVAYETFVCNGENGSDGTDGSNGYNSVVRTETIEEGDVCEEGGFLFSSGLDLNSNGVLDDDEITSQETICNGEDGLSVLYNITTIEETDSCPTGGILIETGLDANENGSLDSDEVSTTNFVCNGLNGIDGTNGYNSIVTTEEFDGGVIIRSGLDINNNNILDSEEVMSESTIYNGEDGQDGTDGQDGLNSLIKLDQLEASQDFPTGGVKISTGLDLNSNGVLDDNEISNIAYISNGTNGNDGIDGQDGQDGTDGTNGVNGLNSLIRILENTPNDTSTTVQVGIDENNNGVLEDDEVDNSTVIEDGVDGEDGNDGQDGNDGKCSFIVVIDEPAGENCEFGGVKIITGKDDNGNLIFDEEEIDQTEYVCEYRVCVTTEVVEYTYDFEIFNEGDIVSNYGIIGVYGYRSNFNGNQFMIFDSNNPTGNDWDLGVDSGNIGIISEDNDSNDPDDNGIGGIFTFTFNKPVEFTSLDIIDLEGQHNHIKFIQEDGTEIEIELPVVGNAQIQTVTYNITNVVQVVVSVCESFALDNLKFKCTQVINNCN